MHRAAAHRERSAEVFDLFFDGSVIPPQPAIVRQATASMWQKAHA
jgi:hypothetical protein